MPGTLVRMTPNSPRYSAGASGLGSHMSMWLGPPRIHRMMTDGRRVAGRRSARASLAQQLGERQPGRAEDAGLDEARAGSSRTLWRMSAQPRTSAF